MWAMMARVGGLWQIKMARGSQLTFYVSIFIFSVILSIAAERRDRRENGHSCHHYAFKLATKAFTFPTHKQSNSEASLL